MRAVRLPHEPALVSWRAAGASFWGRVGSAAFLWPWLALLRHRLGRAGLVHNDFLFGRNDSGAMEEPLVRRLAACLPDGVSEIYFHPATRRCPELDRDMPDYHHQQELAALLSPAVRDALRAVGAQPIAFADLRAGAVPMEGRC